MHNTVPFNDGKHIERIISVTNCRRHGVLKGFACFHVEPSNVRMETSLLGVCGPRIKRAGYNGEIDPASIQLKPTGPRPGLRSRKS